MTVNSRKNFIINIAYFAIIIAIVFLFLKYAMGWITPFIIAFAIAYCIQKPIAWVSQKTRLSKRATGAVISVLTILAVLGALVALIYFLANEAIEFFKTLPELTSDFLPQLGQKIESLINSVINFLPGDTENFLHDFNTKFSEQLTSIVGNVATSVTTWAAGFAANIPSVMISFIITIIATIFISMDYRRIVDFLTRQIPERWQDTFRSAKDTFVNTILRFLRAYILLMIIMFFELLVLLGITNLITGNIPYLVVVCALTAIVDVLPVLGTGTVLIPWAVISLIMGDWAMAICLALSYLIVVLIRNFLEPKIIGSSIGLHPLVTLFCMYVGLRLLGFIGMIVLLLIVITLIKVQESGKIKIFK